MEFTIRPVRPFDAEGINTLRRMPGVFENILGMPSERIAYNEECLKNMGQDEHNFVAVTQTQNGELVIGNVGLHVNQRRNRHSGSFGIMVHKDYQGMGVGTKLLEAILDIADNWLMLVRVELTVFVDNERAIGLYKKFGFEIEGTKRKAAVRNGELVDEFIMARLR